MVFFRDPPFTTEPTGVKVNFIAAAHRVIDVPEPVDQTETSSETGFR